VLTQFFNLKEFLTCLPLGQSSQTLPSLYLMDGKPTSMSLESSLFFKALKQVRLFWKSHEMHTLYTFLCCFPLNTTSPVLILTTKYCFGKNTTRLSLSHNWNALNRLWCKPFTRYTFSVEWESDSPILPKPTIVPNLPFPNATLPLSEAVSERRFHFSPIICYEQPLSTYHSWLFARLFAGLFAGLFTLTLACKTN